MLDDDNAYEIYKVNNDIIVENNNTLDNNLDNYVVIPDDKKDDNFLSRFLPQNGPTWYMIVASIVLTILFLVGSYFGVRKKWYRTLPVKSNENTWVVAVLWVIASLISYGIFYFIKDKDESIYGQSRIYPYFVIISFLNVLWVVLYFNNQNTVLTLLIIGIIFALQLYIIIFLFYISIIAAVLLVPLQILYAYLFYSILHLASINNITL